MVLKRRNKSNTGHKQTMSVGSDAHLELRTHARLSTVHWLRAYSLKVLRILTYSGFGTKCGAPHFAPLLLKPLVAGENTSLNDRTCQVRELLGAQKAKCVLCPATPLTGSRFAAQEGFL